VAYNTSTDAVVSSSGQISSIPVDGISSQALLNSKVDSEMDSKRRLESLDEEASGDMMGLPSWTSAAFAKLQVKSSPYVSPYSSRPAPHSAPIKADTVATTQELGSSTTTLGKIGKKKKRYRRKKGAEQASVLLPNGRM
jgi:hypothetical protein